MLVIGFWIFELVYYGINICGLLVVFLFEMKFNVCVKKKYRYIFMFLNLNREYSFIVY